MVNYLSAKKVSTCVKRTQKAISLPPQILLLKCFKEMKVAACNPVLFFFFFLMFGLFFSCKHEPMLTVRFWPSGIYFMTCLCLEILNNYFYWGAFVKVITKRLCYGSDYYPKWMSSPRRDGKTRVWKAHSDLRWCIKQLRCCFAFKSHFALVSSCSLTDTLPRKGRREKNDCFLSLSF